jgi:hypothetical protein
VSNCSCLARASDSDSPEFYRSINFDQRSIALTQRIRITYHRVSSRCSRYCSGRNVLQPSEFVVTMADSPPPWGSWSLDEEFLCSMCRWTVDHPDSSLTRVFDKVIDGVLAAKDLTSFIPDGPFPAKTLVEALFSLLKLGTVSLAGIVIPLSPS